MNDVPIKFRGQTDGGDLIAVKADSICQLLSRDDNGKELYLGVGKILEQIYRLGGLKC